MRKFTFVILFLLSVVLPVHSQNYAFQEAAFGVSQNVFSPYVLPGYVHNYGPVAVTFTLNGQIVVSGDTVYVSATACDVDQCPWTASQNVNLLASNVAGLYPYTLGAKYYSWDRYGGTALGLDFYGTVVNTSTTDMTWWEGTGGTGTIAPSSVHYFANGVCQPGSDGESCGVNTYNADMTLGIAGSATIYAFQNVNANGQFSCVPKGKSGKCK